MARLLPFSLTKGSAKVSTRWHIAQSAYLLGHESYQGVRTTPHEDAKLSPYSNRRHTSRWYIRRGGPDNRVQLTGVGRGKEPSSSNRHNLKGTSNSATLLS